MNLGLIALISLTLAGCLIAAVRRLTAPRSPAEQLVYALHVAARWVGCIAHGADMGLLAFRKLKAQTPIVLECQQEELWSSK